MRELTLFRRACSPIAAVLMVASLALLAVPASAAPPSGNRGPTRGPTLPESADPDECDYEGTSGDDVILVVRSEEGITQVFVNGQQQAANPDAPGDDGETTVCGRGGRDTIIVEVGYVSGGQAVVIDLYGSGGNDLFCTQNFMPENIHGGDGSRDTAYIDEFDEFTKSVERVFQFEGEPEQCSVG